MGPCNLAYLSPKLGHGVEGTETLVRIFCGEFCGAFTLARDPAHLSTAGSLPQQLGKLDALQHLALDANWLSGEARCFFEISEI